MRLYKIKKSYSWLLKFSLGTGDLYDICDLGHKCVKVFHLKDIAVIAHCNLF